MRVAVVLDHRFQTTPDGAVWTDGPFPYSFFKRYLDAFEQVTVVARAWAAEGADDGWRRADGPGVELASTPYYVGPWQYLVRSLAVKRAIRRALPKGEAVILRAPGQLANLAASMLRAYAAEVVGDPFDALAPGANVSALRPFFRWQQTQALRGVCGAAAAVAYVTNHALQKRYPSSAGAFTTSYSSVDLPDEAFADHPPTQAQERPLRLIAVGSLEHLYKGQDVLLQAFATSLSAGLRATLVIVGDGRERGRLQGLTEQLGLGDSVRFAGQLPSGEAVRDELDQADLFVLPSRQEGLPRAMIEAMARGLPCIGSHVGGIPELLPESALVPAGDASALADTLRRFASPEVRQEASIRNLQVARNYADRVLRPRRLEFYEQAKRVAALQ